MKNSDLPFMPEFYDRYIHLAPDELRVVEGLKQSQDVLETPFWCSNPLEYLYNLQRL